MALWRISSLCFRSRCGLVMQNAFFSSQDRYVIILPEIPDATAQTNSLLSVVHGNDLPPFDKLSTRESADACAKLALEFEAWMEEHGSSFNSENDVCNFENVIDKVEMHLAPMQFAWNTFRHLAGVRSFDPNLMARFKGLQNLVTRARIHRLNNHRFFTAVMDLSHDKNLNSVQSILIAKYIREMQLNGLGLSDKNCKWLEEYRRRIYDAVFKFRRNIEMTSWLLNLEMDFSSEMSDTPQHILEMWSVNRSSNQKSQYKLAFTQYSYAPFMRYCKMRLRRRSIWKLFNSRAGFEEDQVQLNNSLQIEQLRQAREKYAKLFNYNNYLDMVLPDRMISSVSELETIIFQLKQVAVKRLSEQVEMMQPLAARQDALRSPLKPWDLDYYARKLAEHDYDIDFGQTAEYFPYMQFLSNVFELIKRLFDITFTLVSGEAAVWDKEVQLFEVTNENGKIIGHLYIDPFIRKNKLPVMWSECGRARSSIVGHTPIVYLNLNLSSESLKTGVPAFLHWDHLVQFFREIGKSMQILLSQANYSELASGDGIERDCIMIYSFFFEHLFMRPDCLADLSKHYRTNEKLSKNESANFIHAIREMQIPALVQNILLSEFDFLIHKSSMKFWFDIYRELSRQYFPYGWEKGDYLPCNSSIVVDEQIASSYYRQLISDIIACDLINDIGENTQLNSAEFVNFCKNIHLAVAEQPDDDLNALQLTLIQPASEQHIQKWSEEERWMVSETADDYRSITLQYIEKHKLSLQWVQNVLDGTAESERIVYNDPDPEVTIEERYGVPVNRLCIFFHYQPTYYHLHIHFTHLREATAGTSVGRAHLYADVVDNLRSDSDYYAKRTMHFSLRNNDPLLHQLLGEEKQTTTKQDE
ncbi:Oligopeptidase A [Trichinella patagoniensis]|uniref:Oligopeptidase A n=1 Tax=Trichinella patagoniensis TaxID=990121 RepID=A0A0V0ZKD0_9BILA|nr:Oligopeptidase A [Trichinella patagoniensis]